MGISQKYPWDVKCLACNQVCCSQCRENGTVEGDETGCERLAKSVCEGCGHPSRRHIRVLHYEKE